VPPAQRLRRESWSTTNGGIQASPPRKYYSSRRRGARNWTLTDYWKGPEPYSRRIWELSHEKSGQH
jgi:hypothetical protein